MNRWDHAPSFQTTRWAACLIALSLGAAPATSPTTNPTTGPTTGPTPGSKTLPAIETATISPIIPLPATEPGGAKARSIAPFPSEFGVLMSRSIFAHRRGGGPGGKDMATTAPMSLEPGIVLRGVADQAGQRTALLEDVASGKTRQLHVGDETTGGKVVAITMEGLDRSLGGRVLHVAVGQPLDGNAAQPGAATRQSIAREDRPQAPVEPSPDLAMPAGAKIVEIRQ